MQTCLAAFPILRRCLAIALIAATASGSVLAQTYDFKRFVSGGGGGTDPQKKAIAQQAGAFVCLGVGPGPSGNDVRFTVLSKIPQPRSRITAVAFDVGRHTGLFSDMTVSLASSGVTANVVPGMPHPFLSALSPKFWVNVPHRSHVTQDGLIPGKMIVISAKLGAGKTLSDVFNALNEGLDPTTGARGLRVGVIILYLLGGPPPGVATIQDDGGFLMTAPSGVCR